MSSTQATVANASENTELRSGPALVRATKPYAQEDRKRSWRELIITMVCTLGALSVGLFAPIWAKPVGMVFAGLLIIRFFIIFHDTMHGALFTKAPVAQFIMTVYGLLIMSPRSIWKESHDYHHKNNCRLPSTSIGSYPVVTTRLWRRMSPTEKRAYRFARSPLTIVFGYFTIFLGQMCGQAFFRNPKLHWQSGLAPFVHFGLVALVGFTLGWDAAFFGVAGPLMLACALGSYLFYAQHNAPGIYFAPRTAWKYDQAALRSSTMFDMSPAMHWFTGNIGYHHVHHLNHRIPFYRLREAMEGIPELQNPVRTDWRVGTIGAALRLKLWDPTKEELVPFPS